MSSAKKRHAEDFASQKAPKKPKKATEQKGTDRTHSEKKDGRDVKQPKSLSSLLQDEGKAFPRGGGAAITPLERKQLQLKADRDALLEASRPSKKRSSKTDRPDKPGKQNKPNAKGAPGKEPADSIAKPKSQKPRFSLPDDNLTYKDISPGDLMDGRVTRTEDYAVFVQLRAEIAGRIALPELADDYNKAVPRDFKKHQIIKVRVVDVDAPNKRVNLSARTSQTLSSTAPVKDPLITKISDLKIGQIVRGFVKNVAEMGLFVNLGHNVTAFVRITDLSDKFVKDWRSTFEVDQLVRGRVIALDEAANRVQMSLKTSVLAKDYKPQTALQDFKVGDIVDGTIRAVEDYGAFVVIDGSKNVSGLAHRSEVAQTRVEDVRTLYKAGDNVKAKILTIDAAQNRVSFGLKASYFVDASSSDEDADEDGVSDAELSDADGGIDLQLTKVDALASLNQLTGGQSEDDVISLPSDGDSAAFEEDDVDNDDGDDGLDAGDFQWNQAAPRKSEVKHQDKDASTVDAKKRRTQKGKIVEDRTGEIDITRPKSSSDFELLLLGTPNDADIWAKYIALKASEADLDGARSIAERAIRTIAVTESAQKLEIWTVWFNLELQFGTDDAVDEVFKRSCETTDREVIHERFASCCIDVAKQKTRGAQKQQAPSNLLDKAEQTYNAMKKFPECSKRPDFWIDFARFFFNVRRDREAGRALMTRAKQSVVENKFPDLVKGFALLEFHSATGDPERGRTIFASLLETYPKRWDFWEVYIAAESKKEAWDNVRDLYNQATSLKGGIVNKLKKKNVRAALSAWEDVEKKHGGAKGINLVNKRRNEYEESVKNKELQTQDS